MLVHDKRNAKAVHGHSALKGSELPLRAHQAEELARLGIFAFAQLVPFFEGRKDEEGLLNEFFVRLKLERFNRAREVFK